MGLREAARPHSTLTWTQTSLSFTLYNNLYFPIEMTCVRVLCATFETLWSPRIWLQKKGKSLLSLVSRASQPWQRRWLGPDCTWRSVVASCAVQGAPPALSTRCREPPLPRVRQDHSGRILRDTFKFRPSSLRSHTRKIFKKQEDNSNLGQGSAVGPGDRAAPRSPAERPLASGCNFLRLWVFIRRMGRWRHKQRPAGKAQGLPQEGLGHGAATVFWPESSVTQLAGRLQLTKAGGSG